jgi:hypothetical protein
VTYCVWKLYLSGGLKQHQSTATKDFANTGLTRILADAFFFKEGRRKKQGSVTAMPSSVHGFTVRSTCVEFDSEPEVPVIMMV